MQPDKHPNSLEEDSKDPFDTPTRRMFPQHSIQEILATSL